MKNKGIKFYSMILGGFVGFIAYLLLALHDFEVDPGFY